MQLDPARGKASWRWPERLALFCVGGGLSGFFFCAILSWYLFSGRPVLPEPTLGYTFFFTIKSHDRYGTYFEYLTVTYGFWVTWGFGLVSGMLAHGLGTFKEPRTYRRQILAAGIVSMLVFFSIWWVCP